MTTSTPVQEFKMDALGIDVGYFQTKFSHGMAGDKVHVDLFPSVAAPSARTNTSDLKRLSGFHVEVDGKKYFVGPDAANLGTGQDTPSVTNDYSRSSAYKALFLGALASVAQHRNINSGHMVVRQLVVGLPVETFETNNQALMKWTTATHMVPSSLGGDRQVSVQVERCRAIYQPQGAMVKAGGTDFLSTAKAKSDAGVTLILDMGGGTFDWFVADGMKAKQSRSGSALNAGMYACTLRILERFGVPPHDSLITLINGALSDGRESIVLAGVKRDMKEVWEEISTVMKGALKAMDRKIQTMADVQQILITGGGGKVLERVFAAQYPSYAHLAKVDEDPVFSNCKGFHLLAKALIERSDLQEAKKYALAAS